MTTADAYRYLKARTKMLAETKTNRNRLRWSRRDMEAVDQLLAVIERAVERTKQEQASG